MCGGQSSRMGSDKGLLQHRQGTWARTALEKIQQLSISGVVSVNDAQYQEYCSYFSHHLLIKDNATLGIKGPLCGLLSVHLQYPEEDLFILACDMLLMEVVMLQKIYDCFLNRKRKVESLYCTNQHQAEPLCAIYTAEGLRSIVKQHMEQPLPRHSMKFLLEQLQTVSLELSEKEQKYFNNFNTAADLNGH